MRIALIIFILMVMGFTAATAEAHLRQGDGEPCPSVSTISSHADVQRIAAGDDGRVSGPDRADDRNENCLSCCFASCAQTGLPAIESAIERPIYLLIMLDFAAVERVDRPVAPPLHPPRRRA